MKCDYERHKYIASQTAAWRIYMILILIVHHGFKLVVAFEMSSMVMDFYYLNGHLFIFWYFYILWYFTNQFRQGYMNVRYR